MTSWEKERLELGCPEHLAQAWEPTDYYQTIWSVPLPVPLCLQAVLCCICASESIRRTSLSGSPGYA